MRLTASLPHHPVSHVFSFPEHPVSEALFNFIAAWGVLFLPVILTEKKSAKARPPLLQAHLCVCLPLTVCHWILLYHYTLLCVTEYYCVSLDINGPLPLGLCHVNMKSPLKAHLRAHMPLCVNGYERAPALKAVWRDFQVTSASSMPLCARPLLCVTRCYWAPALRAVSCESREVKSAFEPAHMVCLGPLPQGSSH